MEQPGYATRGWVGLLAALLLCPTVSAQDAGLLHIAVHEDGLVGTLVVPDTARAYPGVLRLGGAEGGLRIGDAEAIAAEGYAVLALAYFGIEGLPADLEEVPLEYFGRAIEWMQRSPYVDSTRLAVVGLSRGSTLALLLPTVYDDFDAVVALAPSHVVWQSAYLDWDRYAVRSSLSHRGEALPFVPYDFSNEAAAAGCTAEAAACAPMYTHSLNQHDRVRAALIPVERIGAPVLLLSGKSDKVWPASAMSDLVVQQLAAASYPYEVRHVAYDDAGHCSLSGCFGGGTSEGNRLAVEDLRRQVIEFLGRHLAAE